MDLLDTLVNLFVQNGYAAVFVALMICGAGLPLPEDITLVAGGIIAGLGYANVHVMCAMTLFGVLLGDSAIFLLGHYHGARMLAWRPIARVLTPSRYLAVQEKFDRYGNRLLFAARFLPGMRTTIYVTAGATHRVSFPRFLLIDTMAAMISVPVWVYLGYFGANNHAWLVMWIRRGQGSLWAAAGLLLALLLLLWWRRSRKPSVHGQG